MLMLYDVLHIFKGLFWTQPSSGEWKNDIYTSVGEISGADFFVHRGLSNLEKRNLQLIMEIYGSMILILGWIIGLE